MQCLQLLTTVGCSLVHCSSSPVPLWTSLLRLLQRYLGDTRCCPATTTNTTTSSSSTCSCLKPPLPLPPPLRATDCLVVATSRSLQRGTSIHLHLACITPDLPPGLASSNATNIKTTAANIILLLDHPPCHACPVLLSVETPTLAAVDPCVTSCLLGLEAIDGHGPVRTEPCTFSRRF